MSETHVVALSGGKDSTAMALRLAEVEPDVPRLYVCTPTGNELPEMFEHWRRLGDLLGQSILPIVATSLEERIEHYRRLPNHRQRWCTKEIKIRPFGRFLASHAPAVAYVGLRADEPDREGASYAQPGVAQRYPLREWGWDLADVLGYLDRRGVTIPDRTDCGVCFFQRLGEWFDLWRDHPAAYAEGERWEALTGHTFRSPGRDTWPAPLADLRSEFEQGRKPKGWRPKGERGRQLPLLAEGDKCRVCTL